MVRILYIALMATWFALFVLIFTHTQVLADESSEDETKEERPIGACGG
tara:strand:+ start:1046 stop:1189 length:144 start_codon:yes stop_codon:yes gene_type:complete